MAQAHRSETNMSGRKQVQLKLGKKPFFFAKNTTEVEELHSEGGGGCCCCCFAEFGPFIWSINPMTSNTEDKKKQQKKKNPNIV